MKNCLKIPRLFLPEEGFEKWAVIAADAFSYDRAYWNAVEEAVGSSPSAYRFIEPKALSDEAEEDGAEAIRKAMYESLEKGDISKLRRGGVFVKRKLKGGVREGVVLCVDLEAFSCERGNLTAVRASQKADGAAVRKGAKKRSRLPMEFPHALVFYYDKKDKVSKYLKDAELEKLYDFELMREGGRIRGYFIPEEEARAVCKMLHSRGEPCFTVADGEEDIAAAKAYWEELKPTLAARELLSHPARFFLAEFVNFYGESTSLYPVHRLLSDIEPEAFCDFFQKGVKCKRKGNVLYPEIKGIADLETCARLCDEFLKRNGGRLRYYEDERKVVSLSDEGSAGIVLPETDKKDYLSWMKEGLLLPEKTFAAVKEKDRRYYLEGREISYE